MFRVISLTLQLWPKRSKQLLSVSNVPDTSNLWPFTMVYWLYVANEIQIWNEDSFFCIYILVQPISAPRLISGKANQQSGLLLKRWYLGKDTSGIWTFNPLNWMLVGLQLDWWLRALSLPIQLGHIPPYIWKNPLQNPIAQTKIKNKECKI